jgi:adenylate cyclase
MRTLMRGNAFSTPSLNLLGENGSIGQSYRLEGKNTFRIGRAETNDILLQSSSVSRQHAMVQRDSNGVYSIVDLGSANGTFVNGKRIHAIHRLRPSDRIGIGQRNFVFIQPDRECTQTNPGDILDEKTVAFINNETVTVLVSDLRNFTRLAEVIGDTRTTRLLQIWNSKVNDLICERGGVVDKFIGDAVMAFWHGGQSPAPTVRQALEAALAIEQLTEDLQEQLPEIPWPLKTGAAINTGAAAVGNISGERNDFTVIGDAINVVFRLEEMTGQSGFDLLIGNDTARYIKNRGECFRSQRFCLKGKEQPYTAYGCNFDRLKIFLEQLRLE